MFAARDNQVCSNCSLLMLLNLEGSYESATPR